MSTYTRRRRARRSNKRNRLEKEALNQKLYKPQETIFCTFAYERISIVFPLEMCLKPGKFKSTVLCSQYLGEYLIFLSSVFSVGKTHFTSAVFCATKISKCLRWLVLSTQQNSALRGFAVLLGVNCDPALFRLRQ